ncbi:olfactory receptor class A-like protein 1 [Lissotriton helveticus]
MDEKGCNVNVTVYRICKGMSVCLTSLLSCYQCAVLARPSKLWKSVKEMVVKNLLLVMSSLWCFNTFLNVFTVNSFLWGIQQNATAQVVNLGFCFIRLPSYSVFFVYGAVSVARDLVCVLLMTLSSAYIVLILYRHNRHVKSIRRSEQDWKNAAETKAATVVLILVSLYVFFFGLDSSIWIFSIFASSYVPIELIDARAFFASSYCALSPVVIIVTNKKLKLQIKFMIHKDILESQKSALFNISPRGETAKG